MYTTICEIDNWGKLLITKGAQPGLCDNLKGWDRGWGGSKTLEGRDICILMADSCCCMAETSRPL